MFPSVLFHCPELKWKQKICELSQRAQGPWMILGHREVFSWISSQQIRMFIRLSFFHGINTQMVCCLHYPLIILFSLQVYHRSDMVLHFIPLWHIKYIKCNCFSLVFWTSRTVTFLCWVHEEVRGNQTLAVVLYFIYWLSSFLHSSFSFSVQQQLRTNLSILYTLFSKEEIFCHNKLSSLVLWSIKEWADTNKFISLNTLTPCQN